MLGEPEQACSTVMDTLPSAVAALAVRHHVGEGRLAGEAGLGREGDGAVLVENHRPVLVLVELDDREIVPPSRSRSLASSCAAVRLQHLALLDREALAGDDRLVGAALGLIVVALVLILVMLLRIGLPSLM